MAQRTILMIDDDRTCVELLSDHLRVSGYRTLTASDGSSGLRVAAESKPDLVVLDVMMPGVDDYVTKPFSFTELTARIGAVLARAPRIVAPSHSLTSGDLTIDFDERRVTVAGRTVMLTPTEYRLLETLARHPNRTMPTETLLEQVWGAEYAGEAEHVKHYIWTLRKKIEADPGDPKHLIAERGFGYRFE